MRWTKSYDGQLVDETMPLAGYVGDLLSERDALRGAEIASILQIESLWGRRFDTCSSGEEQLVRIAYCLAQQPRALGLVEPYAFLDTLRREHLMVLLERIERFGMTELAISQSELSTTPAPSFTVLEAESAPLLNLTNVSYRHPLALRYALQGLTLRYERPGLVALVGANGSGKSTLLHLMHRTFRPLSGKVRTTGSYYVPAHELYGPFRGEENRRIRQLQAAFVSGRPLLLFDEPTVHLNVQEREALTRALREQARTALVVCATHDETLVASADHVLYVMQGSLVFDGERDRFYERSLRWSRG